MYSLLILRGYLDYKHVHLHFILFTFTETPSVTTRPSVTSAMAGICLNYMSKASMADDVANEMHVSEDLILG